MLPRFRVQRLGLKNDVKRVLFISDKSNSLHFGVYTVEGDDEDIRTDGRNKEQLIFPSSPAGSYRLTPASFLGIHSRCRGGSAQGNCAHGLSSCIL